MAGRDDDMLRLITVIDHQRRELDRIRASAAQESVVAMARGALMERLGLSSAEAAASSPSCPRRPGSRSPRWPPRCWPNQAAASAATREPARARGQVRARCSAEAAAELAADGAELAGTLAAQVMDPLGAAAVVLWLLEADGALALLGEQGLSRGEAAAGGTSRRSWTARRSGSPAAPPTCGGAKAARTPTRPR